MSKLKRLTVIFSVIFAILVVGFILYAVLFSSPNSTEEVVPVETTTVQLGDIEETTFADGATISNKTRDIFASAAGTVTELHVAENWDVEIDDLLFVVDTGYRDEDIEAPISGTVTSINVAEGTAVSAAQPVMATIQDLGALEIEGQISEFDIEKLQEGQRVYVSFGAIEDEVTGTVTFIGKAPVSALATTTPHYKFLVSLDEIPEALRVGMTASLEIVLEEKEGVPLLDRDYVMTRGGQTYVLQNGQEVVIETGLESDDMVEVVSGLRQGDVVEKEVDEEEEPEFLFGPNAQ